MQESAYAKINLSLDVVSRRTDGYHELSMIMLPLTFHDTLSIEFSDEDCWTSVKPCPFDDTKYVSEL